MPREQIKNITGTHKTLHVRVGAKSRPSSSKVKQIGLNEAQPDTYFDSLLNRILKIIF